MTCFVRIGGGFGNQLFQYALGRRLHLERGIDVVYETGFYSDRSTQSIAHHRFWLAEIGLPMRTYAFSQLRFHTLRRLHRLPAAVQKALLGVTIFSEVMPFTELPKDLDNVLLNGVWSNVRYLGDHAQVIGDEIRRAVGAPSVIGCEAGREPVAVHVRRGDYLAHHSIAKLDYRTHLDTARAALSQKLGKSPEQLQLVVFSDDMEWCRTALADAGVMFSNGQSMLDDFRLMLGCRHFIIANSTFSWWAAYLCDNPQKVVVAPRQWIGERSGRDLGLILPGWIEI